MKSFTFCILLAHVLAFPLFAQKNAAAVTLNLAKAVTQSPKTVLMSELASDVRYFPLETTDNCLLGNECSIIMPETRLLRVTHRPEVFIGSIKMVSL